MQLHFPARVVIIASALLGVTVVAAHAQTAPPPATPTPVARDATPPAGQTVDAPKTSVTATSDDLDRVKKALLTPPAIQIDPKTFSNVFASDARFYATAHGKPVTFLDLVGSFDLMNGPTPYAAMTHEEFMDMSRPHDPIGHVGLTDVAEAAALTVAFSAAEQIILKGIEAIKHAKSEHEIRAIRAQMDKELAALAGTTIK